MSLLAYNFKISPALFLRLPELDEYKALFQLVDDNRDHLDPYMFWIKKTNTAADSKTFIQETRRLAQIGKSLRLMILNENTPIGFVGIDLDCYNSKGEIGYWLCRKMTGQGIITRCLQELLPFFFNTLNLHRLEIFCAESNESSRKIPEKLGFYCEGSMKEAVLTAYGFEDVIIYGMLNKNKKTHQ